MASGRSFSKPTSSHRTATGKAFEDPAIDLEVCEVLLQRTVESPARPVNVQRIHMICRLQTRNRSCDGPEPRLDAVISEIPGEKPAHPIGVREIGHRRADNVFNDMFGRVYLRGP